MLLQGFWVNNRRCICERCWKTLVAAWSSSWVSKYCTGSYYGNRKNSNTSASSYSLFGKCSPLCAQLKANFKGESFVFFLCASPRDSIERHFQGFFAKSLMPVILDSCSWEAGSFTRAQIHCFCKLTEEFFCL